MMNQTSNPQSAVGGSQNLSELQNDMHDGYVALGFSRIETRLDFIRYNKLALGFLNTASFERFSLSNFALTDYFIFLDEFVEAKEKQKSNLIGFHNQDYAESYSRQTGEQTENDLLSTAIQIFGADIFNRRG